MNKLQMAHEMALAIQGTKLIHDMELVSDMAWKYADAMQAEAEKREPSGFPNVLRGACGEIVAVKVDDKEWQPDWIQAPEWANWWCINNIGSALFYDEEPRIFNNGFFGNKCCYAPPFNYQGNWQDSLRKRPQ